ncbi:MAG: aspartate aminotransferase-like enzyme, partial [Verrucomicrobiales bacterium]
ALGLDPPMSRAHLPPSPNLAVTDRARPLLFTPGPVPIAPHLLDIGCTQPPYNRTEEFSAFTHEILDGLNYVFQTQGSVALLTASGTAAMEAGVLNFLNPSDRALVINGGTFGQRWCDLCAVYSIPYDELELAPGEDVDLDRLEDLLINGGYTAVMINAHETSTGQLYDLHTIGELTHRHGVFSIVDAISTVCADEFLMDDWHIDVAILSSQKALALPPGLSFVAMNQKAVDRLHRNPPRSLYFDLRDYLSNQLRGQLPYTSAIGLMLQLHQRLLDIRRESLPSLVMKHRQRAEHFRRAMATSSFEVLPSRPSNAMTALWSDSLDARHVAETLRIDHNIVVAPSGGALKSKLIRISHMGAQDDAGVATLVGALAHIVASPPATHTTIERIRT